MAGCTFLRAIYKRNGAKSTVRKQNQGKRLKHRSHTLSHPPLEHPSRENFHKRTMPFPYYHVQDPRRGYGCNRKQQPFDFHRDSLVTLLTPRMGAQFSGMDPRPVAFAPVPAHVGSFYPVDSETLRGVSLREILDMSCDDYILDEEHGNRDDRPLLLAETSVHTREYPGLSAEEPVTNMTNYSWNQEFAPAHEVSEPPDLISLVSPDVFDEVPLTVERPMDFPLRTAFSDPMTSVENTACVTPRDEKNSSKKRCISSVSDEDGEGDDDSSTSLLVSDRFRPYQEEQWAEHFKSLCEYQEEHGHCLVPHFYPPNPALARWVKRQRYSYKILQTSQDKTSSMTPERISALESIGFCWDSQHAAWKKHFDELKRFQKKYKHCNVPSNYPKLSTWVKCQRRQFKAYREGRHTTLTEERINSLESVGFEWLVRPASCKKARVA